MRWSGAEAPAPAFATASRQLQFAPAECIVSRGNCRAASPLACGAACSLPTVPLGRQSYSAVSVACKACSSRAVASIGFGASLFAFLCRVAVRTVFLGPT